MNGARPEVLYENFQRYRDRLQAFLCEASESIDQYTTVAKDPRSKPAQNERD